MGTDLNPPPGHDRQSSAGAIEVRDMECRYGSEVILTGISFAVRRGEIFFVVGGSGSGKSTLLKNMIGLVAPARGSVHYFGRDFTASDGGRRRQILREVGVLYQSSALWSSMTLADNVALPIQEYTDLSAEERGELVRLKLSQVGLSGYENYYPSELSGGMRKRAALARALALDPAAVFFDEPSAGLDPVTSRGLDRLIREVRDAFGTTMLIVSHELSSILSLADRMILLHKDVSGILAAGSPEELTSEDADPRVREFFEAGAVRPH